MAWTSRYSTSSEQRDFSMIVEQTVDAGYLVPQSDALVPPEVVGSASS